MKPLRVASVLLAGASGLLLAGAGKCNIPALPPGPICTAPGQSCCWRLSGGAWIKAPCVEPSPEPTPEPSASPTPTPSASPSPSPSASPTPEPSPTPNPGPTPASCPPLACIHAQVHLAAGPGGLLPRPTACDGCRVVLDATPLFEVCLARGRCNGEHDTYCHGRVCEQDTGYAWRKVFAPVNVQWIVQEPGPDRGYQVVIQTPVAGAYAWEVCPSSPLDGEGQPVTGSSACGRVEFEVR